jgi:hypothetical protein
MRYEPVTVRQAAQLEALLFVSLAFAGGLLTIYRGTRSTSAEQLEQGLDELYVDPADGSLLSVTTPIPGALHCGGAVVVVLGLLLARISRRVSA